MIPNHPEDHTRYLKKFKVTVTDTELPIQGRVEDPKPLFNFFNDLQDELVPKVIGVYLDDDFRFVGHQVFVGATPESFATELLYQYYFLFLAKHFILLVNHPASDATPTKEDLKLMATLRMDMHGYSFKPSFADYIIVGDDKMYYSMATNEGNVCKCGSQKYVTVDVKPSQGV